MRRIRENPRSSLTGVALIIAAVVLTWRDPDLVHNPAPLLALLAGIQGIVAGDAK